MPSVDYEVIWDGSKRLNRGYLNAVPEVLKPSEPPVFRNVPLCPPSQPLGAQIHKLLLKGERTQQQLQAETGAATNLIEAVIRRLRRNGTLRFRLIKTATVSGTRTVNTYWIAQP